MFEWWWAYLALGAFVGFFSGLLGIGGGSAMVPVLAFIFTAKHFAENFVLHVALGTGMATILFTSLTSVRTHHRHQAVDWMLVRKIAPGVLVGTFGGAWLAAFLDVRVLSVLFTALIYYLATRMLVDKKPQGVRTLPGMSRLSLAAGGIGLISSLTATGGAALVVAYLVRRGIAIHQAIGTAAAIGWPLAAAGTAGYVLSGISVTGLPAYSIGYVYLPALLGIVVASMLLAPVGARMAHRTPGKTLKRVFAVLLYILATRMLISFF